MGAKLMNMGAKLLAGFFWVNVAALLWAILLGHVERGGLSLSVTAFFLIAAIITTAMADR